MLGRIARLYYEFDFTHQQIADMIGWSRVRVTRALQEARRQGIVQITVHTDEQIFVSEELDLISRFGLEHAWVSPSGPDDTFALEPVATIGAQAAQQLIRPGSQVTVGVSRTLAAIGAALHLVEPLSTTTFLPIQGTNPGLVTPPTPSNIAAVFADAFGGQSHALAAPVFATSSEMLEVLERDENVQEAFDLALHSDIAFVGIGGVADRSSSILQARLSDDDLEELRAAGAVGDINARYFDADGQPVSTPATDLVLGPSLEQFRDIPIRVAAAAGPDKVLPIRAALRGGLVTGLITDVTTARALIAESA